MSVVLKSKVEGKAEDRRAMLAERLRKAAKQSIPLSFAQQRLWFLDQLEPNSPLYNVPTVVRITGPLNIEFLRQALETLVLRHESLRTRFVDVDGNPEQVVDQGLKLNLVIHDLSNRSLSHREEEAQSFVRTEVSRPFDLSSGPPIRATLIRLSAVEHWFVLNMHHIVSDEWSLKVCFRELTELYTAACEKRSPELPQLPIQYADYTLWQHDWLRGEVLDEQLAYWRAKLEGNPPVLELPSDHPRPAVQTFRGGIQSRVLPRELADSLTQLGARHNATLFMVTLAAFNALLHRYTEQDDIVVGSPVAGRNRMETERMIGFFVNTLLLRTSASGNPTFEELLRRVRETTLDAYAHGDMPFEKLVERLQPERATTHMPFARVMFALQNSLLEELRWPDLTLRFFDSDTETAKLDLTLVVQSTERGLVVQAEYNRDLFDPAWVGRLLEHFEILLKGVIARPQCRLSELPLLSDAERQMILVDWNRTETEYPREKCVHELFEAQVERMPDAIAVEFGKQTLTYHELNQRANRLAHHLRKLSVGPDVPVGICLERSLELIVAVVAVLKAGGVYVPMEASYPKERLNFMLTDSGVPVLLTQHRLLSRLPKSENVLCLDSDWELIARESRQNLPCVSRPGDLAYIIYTSGSTGAPKGVAVPHRAINRLVLSTNYVQFTSGDRVAQVSNASFDAATFEIWGALLNGGTLVGITQDVALSPVDFARDLRELKISAMFLTAALFNQVAAEVPDAFATVRTMMFGGEAGDPASVSRVLKNNRPQHLVNGYGPTENTTFSACFEVKEMAEDATNVPIGRPISNSQCYILDAHLNPMPVGIPGELHVGGEGLARGYWNRPELTAQRFVPNPFRPEQKLYKTGDLARWLPDGNIEFLGRLDDQVKIRGFRVEPGEIETVLSRHPAVRECVACMRKDDGGNQRLVAYFVAGRRMPSFDELLRFLKERLPDYMVPTTLVPLDALPLTPNGKVDRKALPEPGKGRPLIEGLATPRDAIEVKLTEIWERVLDVHPIGIEDKFFDLGGHSLLAVKLIAQIEKVFGRRLRVATVFQAPTIEQLACIIREEIKEGSALSGTSLVEIQSQGTRAPLFLVHGAGGGMFWGYVNLSRHLGTDQPVYGLKSRGLDGGEELGSIKEMAAQYVKDVRAFQPRGPYHLGGYCFGGNVAFEMARQLRDQGEEVALLALMNCSPPNSEYDRIAWTPAWMARFARNLFYWADYFRHWTPAQRREFFRWKREVMKQRIMRWLGRDSSAVLKVDAGNLVDLSSFPDDERKLWRTHIGSLLEYHPQPYSGRVHLFRSPGHPLLCSFDADYGWGSLAANGVEISIVPGVHEKILEEPCVAALAACLDERIKVVSTRTATRVPTAPKRAEPGATGTSKSSPEIEKQQLEYWKQQLKGAPALLDLPADRPRPAQRNNAAARQPISLSKEITEAVETLARKTDTSSFSVLLAAFQTLLSRYTSATDIVIGGRTGDQGSPNLVALRSDLSGGQSFIEFLGQVRKTVKNALANSILPFEKVVSEIVPEQNASYTPVFQVTFDYQETRNKSADSEKETCDFDLEMHLAKTPAGISGRIEYSKALFDADRIARMAEQFQMLVNAVVQDPSQHLSTLPLMPETEARKVLVEWNATDKEYPRDATLAGLFEDQAKRSPDAIALVDGNERISFAELNARANMIAHQLRALEVGPGKLVGICAKRNWRLLAGILGVLKAGGAYVPLDPNYPKDRLAFILEDTKAPVLLTEQNLRSLEVPEQTRVICLDSDWPEIQKKSSENLPATARGQDLAYVIYTSGSTGKPKGVALEHRNAVAFVYWARDVFAREEIAGVLASTSICFDLSIFEMFVPLSWGGTVILAENALALPGLPAAREVTLVNTVPSAIRELLRVKGIPPTVRVVNLAGEPLITPLVNSIYGETQVGKVYDLYGPSETTTYSTFTLRKPDEPATIGRPLTNEQVYLLDKNRQPVPIGVPGEIYIGGDGVAREYLNRPDLTVEKFLPNPFKQGRLYKTGDLARWRADGNLEFLGRIDHQVKIRGFRIELGEIEAVLRKHPGLRESVVVVREDRPGDKRLAAYVVRKAEAQVDTEELRGYLRKAVPEYMVPPAFVFLDALPLTPNGKVDRKALPVPEQGRSATSEFTEPGSPVEEELAGIWREVLGIERIGTKDNFFELGGHSLLAIQVISRVREKLQIELPLSSLFDAPTIEQLARVVESGESELEQRLPIVPVPREGNLVLSSVQERLWFLDQIAPGGHAYNVPVGLRLKGLLDVFALQRAFNEVVQRHESLRTTFLNKDGQLTQTISRTKPVEIAVSNLESIPPGERESRAQAWLNAEAQRPFDLAQGPLVRVALARLGTSEHLLSVVMHHAISDGWSLTILFEELEMFYRAFAENQAVPEMKTLPVQYADFAAWQRQWMQGPRLQKESEYWKSKLAGAPASIAFPVDRRESVSGASGNALRSIEKFSPATAESLAAVSHKENVTPFMLLMSALAITFGKWARQNDMVIGTVVAGRTRREVENVIGCFMNFLPIRTQLDGGDTVRQFLARVKATVLEAQAHQDCPFEKMVEAVNPERRQNQNPLYNAALLLQNFPEQLFRNKNLQVTAMHPDLEAAQLDLRFEAEFNGKNLSLCCEYKTDLFNAKTIEQFLASYRGVLEAILNNPGAKVADVGITEGLMAQAHATEKAPIEQKIAIAATFTADPIAESLGHWMKRLDFAAEVEFAPFNQVFQELLDPNSLLSKNTSGVNVLLLRLEDLGGDSGSVGIVERGAREFVLAVKSALPRLNVPLLIQICPSKPQHRGGYESIEKMLADEMEKQSGVYLVTSKELLDLYPVTDFDDARGDELGCVPYTPVFFTGLGTMIARKFHSLQRAAYKVIVLDCDQTLWGGVCGEDGARGICLDEPRKVLQEFMRAQHAAGRLLAVCSKNNEEDVREVFSQRLDMPLRREHFAARRMNWSPKSENIKSIAKELNLGLDSFIFVDDNPVECAEVEASCPQVLTLQLPDNADEIPQFLKHCWAFDILTVTAEDARRSEMYRQGRQREESRSLAGSLADFLAGLNLKIEIAPMTPEQLPRVAQLTQRTNQFNLTTIRRTEADIQKLMAATPGTNGQPAILTVSVSDRFGDYGLVGVVVCEARGDTIDVETFLLSCRVLGRGVEHSILSHLGQMALSEKKRWVNVHFHPSAKNKPALDFLQSIGADFKQALNGGFVYAFPAEFAAEVVLDPHKDGAKGAEIGSETNAAIPASAGKKFSRCREIALEANDATKIHQAIEGKVEVRAAAKGDYVAPRTEIEKKICELWQQLLRLDRVGVTDNFFDLGGHSLMAVRLFAELDKLTGRKLPLVTIFQASTVGDLAALAGSRDSAQKSVLVPVQARGSRPPLFLVHGAGGDVLWGYANLAKYMHSDQPVYGIKSRGQIGLEEYHDIERMARYYLEQIRALQPRGPYYLGGYCFGGNIAYEMARQLLADNERVAEVLLIDASPSNAGYERLPWWRPSFHYRFTRNLFYWIKDFVTTLEPAEQRRYIVRKARVFGRKVVAKLQRKRNVNVDLDEVIDVNHFPESELKFWRIHLNALVAHVERPYAGSVTLLRTRGQPVLCSCEEDFCWGQLARGGVKVKLIPGSHENVFMEPNVKYLANAMEECLAASMPAKTNDDESKRNLTHELV